MPYHLADLQIVGGGIEHGGSISRRAKQRAGIDDASRTKAFIANLMTMAVQQIIDPFVQRLPHQIVVVAMRESDAPAGDFDDPHWIVHDHTHVPGVRSQTCGIPIAVAEDDSRWNRWMRRQFIDDAFRAQIAEADQHAGALIDQHLHRGPRGVRPAVRIRKNAENHGVAGGGTLLVLLRGLGPPTSAEAAIAVITSTRFILNNPLATGCSAVNASMSSCASSTCPALACS